MYYTLYVRAPHVLYDADGDGQRTATVSAVLPTTSVSLEEAAAARSNATLVR